MVAAGMGIALVPRWVAMLRVPGGSYKPLAYELAGPPSPEAELGVCWRKHQKLASRDIFLDFVLAVFSAEPSRAGVQDNVTPLRCWQMT
jgi:DNA-binding transcriptional LysR family regulator